MWGISVYKFIDSIEVSDTIKVPYSDLATHVGIAGFTISEIKILEPRWVEVSAYGTNPKTFAVSVKKTEGLPTELIPIEFINANPLLAKEFAMTDEQAHL